MHLDHSAMGALAFAEEYFLARSTHRRAPESITVQTAIRRASVAITLDTYSHMLPGMGGEAADAIGEALG